MNKQIAALCEEYHEWCKENGLPRKSADELIVLLQERIQWLEQFQKKWQAAIYE